MKVQKGWLQKCKMGNSLFTKTYFLIIHIESIGISHLLFLKSIFIDEK